MNIKYLILYNKKKNLIFKLTYPLINNKIKIQNNLNPP